MKILELHSKSSVGNFFTVGDPFETIFPFNFLYLHIDISYMKKKKKKTFTAAHETSEARYGPLFLE